MSGRRCRALRAAFKAEHGRAPNKTQWREGGYIRSEWRRLKKGGSGRHEARWYTFVRVERAGELEAKRARKRRSFRFRRSALGAEWMVTP